MNALWDGDVVALLDFEFAMLGPAEIDVCRLVGDLVSDDGTSIDPDASYTAAAAGRVAACSAASWSMSPIATRAPWAAKTSARASPIPRAPPVMVTV